ncbi:hypothetical protein L21SP5_00218 [Salinivirga cyanobacteriivorans]|uniref:Uncharacterized protein n=1 Tax=Salinivirga cyanobacteriivorans TaxID=1307839 RepID=A0A0S2HV52_9BACT|nr:hypothetical protein [Salinivirga cyanobacteriivorans]ALO13898.1 hypothetical protein L21SP5_00218 [Salinivirga cyanobacteriivorans]
MVSWDVEYLPALDFNQWDTNGDGLVERPTTDYSNEMRDVWRSYLASMQYDPVQQGQAYLFVIPGITEGGDVRGYMPIKSRYGFVTADATTRDVAHELGHGVFNLRHTFSEENSFTLPQGETDNLMDYSTGTELWKYQWDLIHNPEGGWHIFEDVEEGLYENEDYFCVFLIDNTCYYITKGDDLDEQTINMVKNQWPETSTAVFQKWTSDQYLNESYQFLSDYVNYYLKKTDGTILKYTGNARYKISEDVFRKNELINYLNTNDENFTIDLLLAFSQKTISIGTISYGEPSNLRILCKRADYPEKYYLENSFIGDEENGEAELNPGETLLLTLQEMNADETWSDIENATWQIGDQTFQATEFELEIFDGLSEIEVAKTPEDPSISIIPYVKHTDPPPVYDNKIFNVTVASNVPVSEDSINRMYNRSLQLIQSKETNMYNDLTSTAVNVNVTYKKDDPGNPNTTGTASYAPYWNLDDPKDVFIGEIELEGGSQKYSQDDLIAIPQTNSIVVNAVLLARLQKDEKNNILDATAGDISQLRNDIKRKIAAYSPTMENQLISAVTSGNIENVETLIETLCYRVTEENATDYADINSRFNIVFYYNPIIAWNKYGSNQKDNNATVAHEFMHAYYSRTEFLKYLLWDKIRKFHNNNPVYSLGDSEADSQNGGGCSAGHSHEKHNPQNTTVCGVGANINN